MLTGNRAFYPAAALYAALFLPVSVLAVGARGPQWHAHEMLFGFALAVVAGNQLGTLTGWRLYLILAAWAAARIAVLVVPDSLLSDGLNIFFASVLALQSAPRLFGAAKKWRNQALPSTLLALCASLVAIHLGWNALIPAVLLFALLMLFMGGRLIAPAVAGQLERQGVKLAARVQPRIEGALIVAMALAVVASLAFEFLIGIFCLLAGVLAALRLVRWRLWALRRRPDLLCLAAGYAWLAFGLVAYGVFNDTATLHFITVGAIGTLTFNVMALAWLLRARRDPARASTVVWGTLLIAVAVLLRTAGEYVAAALAWSAAFTLLLALFAASGRPRAVSG